MHRSRLRFEHHVSIYSEAERQAVWKDRAVEGVEGGVPLSRRTRFNGKRRARSKSDPIPPSSTSDPEASDLRCHAA